MDRRLAIAALGAAAAFPLAGRAFAQSGGPAQRPQNLNVRHLEDTMQVGTVALATSRMALEKARDPRVKQFAQFEVAEQETIAAVLKAMQEPDTTATTQNTGGANGQPAQAGTSSRMADSNAQPSLGPQGGPMVDKMQDLNGAEFDRAYLKAQLDGHRQLLQIQDAALQAGGPREQMGVARMARTQISEHIVLLQGLEQAVGRG
jgi:putative membrane protein